jgi:hypothetical protein
MAMSNNLLLRLDLEHPDQQEGELFIEHPNKQEGELFIEHPESYL